MADGAHVLGLIRCAQMGSLFALTEVPIVRRILEAPSSTVPGSCQVSARTFSRDADTISRPLTTSSTRIHTGTSDTSRSQFSAFRLLAAVRAVTDALSSMNKGDPALTADVALAILNSAGSPAMASFLKDVRDLLACGRDVVLRLTGFLAAYGVFNLVGRLSFPRTAGAGCDRANGVAAVHFTVFGHAVVH